MNANTTVESIFFEGDLLSFQSSDIDGSANVFEPIFFIGFTIIARPKIAVVVASLR